VSGYGVGNFVGLQCATCFCFQVTWGVILKASEGHLVLCEIGQCVNCSAESVLWNFRLKWLAGLLLCAKFKTIWNMLKTVNIIHLLQYC